IIDIRNPSEIYTMFSLLELVIVVSFTAFLYFLIMYPSIVKGDNIKPSYILHIFPFLSILAAEFLYKLKEKSIRLYIIIVILIIFSVVHNFPIFFTRYTPWQ
ncbi:MAG: hypothetical protein NC828_01850, partial [Candidatus Omnitrophica bacterium]|nr:hypothetical protein [Candidatus Omnitrophota bacterium]